MSTATAKKINSTNTNGSGSNTAINFWIPDTDFGNFGQHKVNMCVNSNDPTRSILLFEAGGGNGNNFNIKMATIGTSGNYNTKTAFTLSTVSNEILNMGIDDNYIWIIDVNFNSAIYTISSYTYTGTLVSSTPITAFAAGFLPSTMTIVGNKLWVAEYNAFSTTLREYNITGSTVSFATSYPVSLTSFFGFNLYKDTLTNNNMLFCMGWGNSYNVWNYVTNTNQTAQSTEIDTTSGAVALGNYRLFAFQRPNNNDWLTWSDNDTNASIKTFASDNLGMGSAFYPQGITL